MKFHKQTTNVISNSPTNLNFIIPKKRQANNNNEERNYLLSSLLHAQTKECQKCNKKKTLDLFRKNFRYKDNYNPLCLACLTDTEIDITMTKVCTCCEKEKHIHQFSSNTLSPDRKNYRCTDCRNSIARNNYNSSSRQQQPPLQLLQPLRLPHQEAERIRVLFYSTRRKLSAYMTSLRKGRVMDRTYGLPYDWILGRDLVRYLQRKSKCCGYDYMFYHRDIDVDHIYGVSFFIRMVIEMVIPGNIALRVCFHFTNLQLLPHYENQHKGTSVNPGFNVVDHVHRMMHFIESRKHPNDFLKAQLNKKMPGCVFNKDKWWY